MVSRAERSAFGDWWWTVDRSLLAGLVHAGFPFVADDIVPLEEGSGLVWPVPLAISI